MGHGAYSSSMRHTRAVTDGLYTKSANEIFNAKSINNAMNPHGVEVRESRDTIEHPNTVPIVVALDVTGSMGSVPHHLVKEGLPHVIQSIIDAGVPDPQVLFLGIGDHECDSSPLQVGQFESSDELMDKWLTDLYREGGGGANEGESYLLAWYFAGYRTSIDSFEKRDKKGLLFTIGDEPVLNSISNSELKNIMGPGQYENFTAKDLLEKAREKYNVYHIHISETRAGSIQSTSDGWKDLIGENNLIIAQRHTDVSSIIANKVITETNEAEEANIHDAL